MTDRSFVLPPLARRMSPTAFALAMLVAVLMALDLAAVLLGIPIAWVAGGSILVLVASLIRLSRRPVARGGEEQER